VGVPIEYLDGVAHITLGGTTTRVRTYGELVTPIINPSHRVALPHLDAGAIEAGEVVLSPRRDGRYISEPWTAADADS
jgi:hypothetical protein